MPATDVDLLDPRAWDDSEGRDDWTAALAEYRKYHSIQAQGERVEDVLSVYEIEQLNEPIHLDNKQSGDNAKTAIGQDEEGMDKDDLMEDDEDLPTEEAEDLAEEDETLPHENVAEPIVEENVAVDPRPTGAPQMPTALLSSIQDENMKNLMMSWYYAGYYTGLHEGQQQALQDGAAKTKKAG